MRPPRGYVTRATYNAALERNRVDHEELVHTRAELAIVREELDTANQRHVLRVDVPRHGKRAKTLDMANQMLDQVAGIVQPLSENQNTKSVARKLCSILGLRLENACSRC